METDVALPGLGVPGVTAGDEDGGPTVDPGLSGLVKGYRGSSSGTTSAPGRVEQGEPRERSAPRVKEVILPGRNTDRHSTSCVRGRHRTPYWKYFLPPFPEDVPLRTSVAGLQAPYHFCPVVLPFSLDPCTPTTRHTRENRKIFRSRVVSEFCVKYN